MARNINEIITSLPKQEREWIVAKAAQMSRETAEYANSVGEIRRAMDKTQSEIARKLGVGQVAVAQLEKRTDLLLSTLRRYVRAAGAELSLVVRTKQGTEIVLQSLGEVAMKRKPAAKAKTKAVVTAAGRRPALAGAR